MRQAQSSSTRSVVIVAYRPKPSREQELLCLTREHVPYLRSLGFATERIAVIARAKDGSIVEVFEWEAGAVEQAHQHPGVIRMWERYFAICSAVPLNTLEEAQEMFAAFEPLAL